MTRLPQILRARRLYREILAMDLRDAEGAARRLISHARAVGKHEDDMTVCVLRLVRRHG